MSKSETTIQKQSQTFTGSLIDHFTGSSLERHRNRKCY